VSLRRAGELIGKVAVPVLALGALGAALTGRAGPSEATAPLPRVPLRAVPVTGAELVCPGAETTGVRGALGEQPAPAPARLTGASPPSQVPGAGVGPGGLTLQTEAGDPLGTGTAPTAGGLLATGSVSQARSVVLRADGSSAPGAFAEQTTVVAKGDLRGLTSAPCLPPSDDIWLVGGGGEPGRRGRLVITNPGGSASRVSIDVLSASGRIARTSGSTVPVPPRSRLVLLLDALAPGVASPVLHLRSSGGPVGATLHDARLDGIVPRGTDDVSAGMAPARRVRVPGVALPGPGASAALVRVGVPGSAEAVVQVRMIGEKGPVELPDGGVLRVPASSTKDVDLSDLPAGPYAVLVSADVPVVAGAMTERRPRTTGPSDFAWVPSGAPLTTVTGVAATSPSTVVAAVLLSAPGPASGSLGVLSVTGEGEVATSTLQISAGSSRTVVLPAGRTTWLIPQRGSGPVLGTRFLRLTDPAGPLIAAAPLVSAALTEVPADVAPARE
jgi:hypothetical protein